MITDVQSNKVYFSKRLTWYKCWKELNRVLDEAGIDFDLLENTNDKWVRDFMPVQLEKDKFVSYIYNPDYHFFLTRLKYLNYPNQRIDTIVFDKLKAL